MIGGWLLRAFVVAVIWHGRWVPIGWKNDFREVFVVLAEVVG